jgi:hypothetical protein
MREEYRDEQIIAGPSFLWEAKTAWAQKKIDGIAA